MGLDDDCGHCQCYLWWGDPCCNCGLDDEYDGDLHNTFEWEDENGDHN